jgi:NTP pyrophosphatase (non-canonical NTP hydrolase)
MHRDEALREAEKALRLVVESGGSAVSLAPAATALAAVRSGQARVTVGDWFERLGFAVEGLHEANAQHKRGWRLQDRSPLDAMLHAIKECAEVAREEVVGDRAKAAQELGDVFGCLVHYAGMAHLDLKAVFQAWLQKIPQDFPDVPPLLLKETGAPL